MSNESEYQNPYVIYGDRVLEQVAWLPLQSRWAFDLACLAREVVVYEKVSHLCGAEHLLDVPGILGDLWGWLLEGRAVPPPHTHTIESAIPYPKGPDFFGFRLDILGNLLSAVGRALSCGKDDSLCGVTAERNINIVLGFLCVSYDLVDNGVEANQLVINNSLILREIDRQQEDLKLLYAAGDYTTELGRQIRELSTGYDLFDGEWFPQSKLPRSG
ncbi:MAG: hypothetical protein K2V38_26300 [Gemmataceae bacterium]|nr:hypothetical protein [Gemmataceae bacterium]